MGHELPVDDQRTGDHEKDTDNHPRRNLLMQEELPDGKKEDRRQGHERNTEREGGDLKGPVVQKNGRSFQQGVDEKVDDEGRGGADVKGGADRGQLGLDSHHQQDHQRHCIESKGRDLAPETDQDGIVLPIENFFPGAIGENIEDRSETGEKKAEIAHGGYKNLGEGLSECQNAYAIGGIEL